MTIARRCDSPIMVLELGRAGLAQHVRENMVRHQVRTVLAWASQAAKECTQDGPLHHAIWTDLYDLDQPFLEAHLRRGAGTCRRPGANSLHAVAGDSRH